MTAKKRPFLMPTYMKEFRCIGSSCEDTCCAGWVVHIDRDTYKRYNKVREVRFRQSFAEHILRNRTNPSIANYAKIDLDNNGTCPFLTDEKLCAIHAELGESYLSEVCSTYPRSINEVNGVLEKAATISCPEVARLALLDPKGIEFEEVIQLADGVIHRRFDARSDSLVSKPERFFWELRIFTITILQERSYPLSDRLIILGLFFRKLADLVAEGLVQQIPDLIAQYTKLIVNKAFKGQLDSIPSDLGAQLRMLQGLTQVRIDSGINSQRYRECLKEVIEGLQLDHASKNEEIITFYETAHAEYYLPFMRDHEYVYENYLVNYVFKNLFPFAAQRSIFDEYALLIVHYAMIKMHLIGIAAYHKHLTTDLVLRLMQSFSKAVEHNPIFLAHILELLHENQAAKLSYMTVLIKTSA